MKLRPTVQYSVIQGLYWGSFGCVFVFASVFLLSCGLTNSQTGAVIALGSILAAVLQPIAGSVADRSCRPILRYMLIALSSAMILVCGILLSFGRMFWIVALCYGLLIGFVQVVMPLTYALAMHYIRLGVPVSFGVCRGIGSLTYALFTSALGILTEQLGMNAVIWTVLLVYALMIPAVALFRFRTDGGIRETGLEGAAHTASAPFFRFLEGHRRFVCVLAGNTLVFISYNMLGDFLYQIILNIGSGSREMGFAVSLAALCELPALFFLGKIGRRFHSGTLLKVSECVMFLKALGLLLARSIGTVYGTMLLQVCGYGLFAGISVFYVSDTVEPENQVRGQSLMTMTITAGVVLGGLIGGLLLDRFSVHVMLLVSAAIALIGAAVVTESAEKGELRGNTAGNDV